MNELDLMKKIKRRIMKEGIIKSLFVGLSVACIVFSVSTLLFWFFGFKAGLWIGVGIFFLLVLTISPLAYYFRFRPMPKTIARRIDELGLEERMITMNELEKDSSYIAERQRKDAMNALHRVDRSMIKIAVSAGLCILMAVTAIIGVNSAIVGALYAVGVIPSGRDLLAQSKPVSTYIISYAVEEESEGDVVFWTQNWEETESAVGDLEYEEGEQAKAVLAVPAGNWVFVQWSDGSKNPFRPAFSVYENLSVKAQFVPVDEVGVEDPEMEDLENQMSQNPSGEGSPDENNPSGEQEGDPNGEPNDESDAGGAHNTASQQIYDGQTYYGDDYSSAYEEAMDRLGSDDDVPDEMKEWITDYYESIEKN